MANILPTTMEYFDKLLGEQLLEGEGGGGSSWQTVFEGSVTTEAVGERNPYASLPELANLSADTIRVTFNGVEYTCEKIVEDEDIFAYGDDSFIEYPFYIDINPRSKLFVTQTAGTYTLKIEEPQSGGSSDFSTAEVTIINNKAWAIQVTDCPVASFEDEMLFGGFSVDANRQYICDVITYKGHAHIFGMMTGNSYDTPVDLETEASVSGNAEYDTEEEFITITGDCTITIS